MGKTTNKTVMLSGRVNPQISDMTIQMSKGLKISKTAVLESAIANYFRDYKEGVDVSVETHNSGGVINLDSIRVNKSETNDLLSVGVGLTSGVLGYKLAKWVRQNYFNADGQDKGDYMDVVGGFVVGVAGALITDYLQRKK